MPRAPSRTRTRTRKKGVALGGGLTPDTQYLTPENSHDTIVCRRVAKLGSRRAGFHSLTKKTSLC